MEPDILFVRRGCYLIIASGALSNADLIAAEFKPAPGEGDPLSRLLITKPQHLHRLFVLLLPFFEVTQRPDRVQALQQLLQRHNPPANLPLPPCRLLNTAPCTVCLVVVPLGIGSNRESRLKRYTPGSVVVVEILHLQRISRRIELAVCLGHQQVTRLLMLFCPLKSLLCIFKLTEGGDRKSTRLNSSHVAISYAVFCLKKKRDSDNRRLPAT